MYEEVALFNLRSYPSHAGNVYMQCTCVCCNIVYVCGNDVYIWCMCVEVACATYNHIPLTQVMSMFDARVCGVLMSIFSECV